MKKRVIGNSGIEASVISLGTWAMGGDEQWGAVDDDSSLKAIFEAVDRGINLIDTAPAYGFGHSEELVGKVLKEFPREKLVIETKCGVWWKTDEGTPIVTRDGKTIRRNLSRKAMLTEVDDSLRRLGVDHIDIYVTHQQPMEPFMVEIGEIMDTLKELKKAGKIRAIGISNASREQFDEYRGFGQIDLIQERFSMLDDKKMKGLFPVCREDKITTQAYSPLEQGLLTGKIRMDYQVEPGNVRNKIPWFAPEKRRPVIDMLDSWADLCEKYDCNTVNLVIAWSVNASDTMNVICGGRKPAHVADYIKGGELTLAAEDILRMNRDIAKVTGGSL